MTAVNFSSLFEFYFRLAVAHASEHNAIRLEHSMLTEASSATLAETLTHVTMNSPSGVRFEVQYCIWANTCRMRKNSYEINYM